MYIKNSEGWDRDDKKEKIKTVIKEIAHKNFKYIPIWKESNPTALDVTTKKNAEYMKIVNQVMSSISPEDEGGINRIIKNVANEVTIDKEFPGE